MDSLDTAMRPSGTDIFGNKDGVTLEPANPVIMHGEKETKITVTLADDAALGDFNVKVTGHPTKGADSTNDLKITVAKK